MASETQCQSVPTQEQEQPHTPGYLRSTAAQENRVRLPSPLRNPSPVKRASPSRVVNNEKSIRSVTWSSPTKANMTHSKTPHSPGKHSERNKLSMSSKQHTPNKPSTRDTEHAEKPKASTMGPNKSNIKGIFPAAKSSATVKCPANTNAQTSSSHIIYEKKQKPVEDFQLPLQSLADSMGIRVSQLKSLHELFQDPNTNRPDMTRQRAGSVSAADMASTPAIVPTGHAPLRFTGHAAPSMEEGSLASQNPAEAVRPDNDLEELCRDLTQRNEQLSKTTTRAHEVANYERHRFQDLERAFLNASAEADELLQQQHKMIVELDSANQENLNLKERFNTLTQMLDAKLKDLREETHWRKLWQNQAFKPFRDNLVLKQDLHVQRQRNADLEARLENVEKAYEEALHVARHQREKSENQCHHFQSDNNSLRAQLEEATQVIAKLQSPVQSYTEQDCDKLLARIDAARQLLERRESSSDGGNSINQPPTKPGDKFDEVLQRQIRNEGQTMATSQFLNTCVNTSDPKPALAQSDNDECSGNDGFLVGTLNSEGELFCLKHYNNGMFADTPCPSKYFAELQAECELYQVSSLSPQGRVKFTFLGDIVTDVPWSSMVQPGVTNASRSSTGKLLGYISPGDIAANLSRILQPEVTNASRSSFGKSKFVSPPGIAADVPRSSILEPEVTNGSRSSAGTFQITGPRVFASQAYPKSSLRSSPVDSDAMSSGASTNTQTNHRSAGYDQGKQPRTIASSSRAGSSDNSGDLATFDSHTIQGRPVPPPSNSASTSSSQRGRFSPFLSWHGQDTPPEQSPTTQWHYPTPNPAGRRTYYDPHMPTCQPWHVRDPPPEMAHEEPEHYFWVQRNGKCWDCMKEAATDRIRLSGSEESSGGWPGEVYCKWPKEVDEGWPVWNETPWPEDFKRRDCKWPEEVDEGWPVWNETPWPEDFKRRDCKWPEEVDEGWPINPSWPENVDASWPEEVNASWSASWSDEVNESWPEEVNAGWPEEVNASWSASWPEEVNASWAEDVNTSWPEELSGHWLRDGNDVEAVAPSRGPQRGPYSRIQLGWVGL